jgi:gliding motility-associated-like protein
LVKQIQTNLTKISFLMKQKLLILLFFCKILWSQNISLYNQFNGRFDFTFVGNTLNPAENSFQFSPSIFTSSSANLTLNVNDNIEKAYLYWAGCGTGDFDITLNNNAITASRTFSNVLTQGVNTYNFFSAFADVTSIVQNNGNGTYTVADLDVSNFINFHYNNRTNFAGWAMIVIYKNTTLPLNQLNVYDGMQVVSIQQNFLNVNLDALNVIDNQDAKIGFLAWEGDSGLAVNETLRINGNIISNPPLNPANNAFNSTNSVTNSNQLYNMDLDIYNIQNNIGIGDTNALIQLTSGQDYVMVNAIVTKLNSQLPDATVEITNTETFCNDRNIPVSYVVRNVNATADLPANTPIAFYANDILVGTANTQNILPIDGTESGNIILSIPSQIPLNFTLRVKVDDNGQNIGQVTELNENNNNFIEEIRLLVSPSFNALPNITSCNIGFTKGIFDFSNYLDIATNESDIIVSFHETQQNANNNSNALTDWNNFEAESTPKTIYIRLENTDGCISITSFNLLTENCPPTIYNAVTPNGDNLNEVFYIAGLKDIFVNYKLEVYNRWGRLLWTGNNSLPFWDGKATNAITNDKVPDGTYYYILYLNDPKYPEPLNGYLYVKK